MAISPIRMMWLLVFSLGFGAFCGLLNDVNRLIRIMLGIKYVSKRFEGLRSIKLPVIGAMSKEKKERRGEKLLTGTLIFLQDTFLFFFAGIGTVIINYYFNDGRLRIYAPMALLIGFLIYYFTVGKLVIAYSDVLVFLFRAFFAIFLAVFYIPIRSFVEFLVKIFKKIVKKLNKTIAKRQKKVYNNKKESSVLSNSKHGFIKLPKNSEYS